MMNVTLVPVEVTMNIQFDSHYTGRPTHHTETAPSGATHSTGLLLENTRIPRNSRCKGNIPSRLKVEDGYFNDNIFQITFISFRYN